jgi:hypothetical protein
MIIIADKRMTAEAYLTSTDLTHRRDDDGGNQAVFLAWTFLRCSAN